MQIHELTTDEAPGELWGQKASRLSLLNRLGLKVPRSWALSTRDLCENLELSTLQNQARFADRYRSCYQDLHAEHSARVQITRLPYTLVKFLKELLQLNPDTKQWIVRSNHSTEDGEKHSFAGVYTSLVVPAEAMEIERAIKLVVMQSMSWECQMQLLQAGIDPLCFFPGILLQPYIKAERSGVYFSRHPKDPWSQNALCEWTSGVAAELVEGNVNGNQEVWAPDETPADPLFAQIHSEGQQIASAFKGSVDCEWVWDGKVLHWVQSRPIADLKTRLADRLTCSPELSRADMKERFPEPLSRMGWSVLDTIIAQNLRSLDTLFGLIVPDTEQLVVNYKGIIYSNREFFQLKGVKWRKSTLFKSLNPIKLLQIFGSALRHRNRSILKLHLKNLVLESAMKKVCDHWDDTSHQTELEAISKLIDGSDQDLHEAFSRLEALSQSVFAYDMATFVLRESYYTCFRDTLGSDKNVQLLLNKERSVNHDLYQDSEDLRLNISPNENPGFYDQLANGKIALELLGPKEQTVLMQYLEKYGAMNDSWDVMKPTWQEDPQRLHAFFTAPRIERSVDSTERPPELPEHHGLRSLFEKLIQIVKTDDREHYFGAKILYLARRMILEAGQRLVKKGTLTETQQIFGLTLSEAKEQLLAKPSFSLAVFAEQHLQEHQRMSQSTPSEVLNRPASAPIQPKDPQGIPVSDGRVEGRLCFLRSAEDLRDLDDDSILAVVSPNPAYIPLFSQVRGLACETGGLLSHSFVVAREIMLPAVTQIQDLHNQFEHGERVILDGSTGEIKRVDAHANSSSN